ncbi:MAG: 4-hydroxy-tetrahydrodipicolinate reductase [Candidatus Brocadiia bacterium]
MRIAVNGAAGAMGRRVVALVAQADDCELVAALERPEHPDLDRDAGGLAGVGQVGVALTTEMPASADVLVDFSAPAAAMQRAHECAERGIPLVMGTTGLSETQRAELHGPIAERVPVLVAPNMSVGVNLLFRLVAQAASALPAEYDVEIVEAHHRRKKDAPSGTAMELVRRAQNARGGGQQELVHGRQGPVGPRSRQEIGVHAVRGGDIVGDHTVLFAGEGERLELTHKAGSRAIFARGAVTAARYLVDKPAGLYTMDDVLS